MLKGECDVTGMRAGGMMRGAIGRPVVYNPQPQRELINVPVTDQTQNYPTGYKHNRQHAETNSYTPNTEVKQFLLLLHYYTKLLCPSKLL